jgi:hypothetical protein
MRKFTVFDKVVEISTEEKNISGKMFRFPTIKIDLTKIAIKGKYIKKAEVKDEWDQDIDDPALMLAILKKCGIRIDLFTFIQRLPDSRPKFRYFMEWDNIAAIPIGSYQNWYNNQIKKQTRNRLKKGKKKGVTIKEIEMDESLFNGISEIYNETDIKQGRKNWHYGISLEKVRKINSTFSERSDFIGAFYKEELIGYIKIVYSDKYARTMGILCKEKHRNKYTMNLLIEKAVEICAKKNVPFLTYAKYDYGKVGSDTLQEFKKNNGFEHIIVPRYYIPLSLYGKIYLMLKLYRGKNLLPNFVIKTLLTARQAWYEKKPKASIQSNTISLI